MHFGEIRLLNDCPRTATVISLGYNIICKLENYHFFLIEKKYPILKELLIKSVKSYSDILKSFFYNNLSKVPYFREQDDNDSDHSKIDSDLFHHLMYTFERVNYDAGDIVLK